MSGARYPEIAQDLKSAIAEGRFPVGALLPTELELCDRYEASRHAVRAALYDLERAGFVSRKKRVGTRVERSRPSEGFGQSLASVEDLVQFGESHRREVREIAEVVADKRLATELGCESGRRFLRISSVRRAGEDQTAPVGWTDVYVDIAVADIADAVRAAPNLLVSHVIEQRYGRRALEVRQEVEASQLSDAMAGALDAKPGDAALRIVRRYVDDAGETFQISLTTHPAGRFTLSSRLTRLDA